MTVPDFILQSIPDSFQEEFAALQEAHINDAVVSVRMNPAKAETPSFQGDSIPWCAHGYYLQERPLFTADPLFHAGVYYVQEASSMFLAEALKQWLPQQPGMRVLDLCASPGGKSTLTVAQLPEDALLLSNEVIGTRVNTLVENAVKWGFDNQWISNNDARDFAKLENFFDVVLVDAPCSGSGLFRKMPDYTKEIKAEDISFCAARQERILADVLPCLKKNGLLIYMTCSFSEQENEGLLDTLCETQELETISLTIPEAWGIAQTRSAQHAAYGYRFFPHRLRGEGFFLAGFRKTNGEERLELSSKSNHRNTASQFQSWVQTNNKLVLSMKDMYFLFHEGHAPLLEYLQKKLKLVKKGVLLGKIAGKDFIPDHELAMYSGRAKGVPCVDLNRQEAIFYLKKETLPPLAETVQLGWLLVCFQGYPLGWIKNLGKRVNNYYPSAYRIMSKNIV